MKRTHTNLILGIIIFILASAVIIMGIGLGSANSQVSKLKTTVSAQKEAGEYLVEVIRLSGEVMNPLCSSSKMGVQNYITCLEVSSDMSKFQTWDSFVSGKIKENAQKNS